MGLVINRLCRELIENHNNFEDTVLIGVQPRGSLLGKRISKCIQDILNLQSLKLGLLDISFFRDDFRRKKGMLTPHETNIDFNIENVNIIIIDDVLYTGRTIRSALDALGSFGRPKSVELLVLIDRRFSRDLPIQPNYVGSTINIIDSEKIIVEWKEINGRDQVVMKKNNHES